MITVRIKNKENSTLLLQWHELDEGTMRGVCAPRYLTPEAERWFSDSIGEQEEWPASHPGWRWNWRKKWSYQRAFKFDDLYYDFTFKNKRHATLFKLTWGGR